ncbi:hypothetical protein JXB41_09125 [Candidatus Woesearchaeota archaeon]|nr:hypothetical protein [Candidatus Woesearchaeota archaeon]
MTSKAPEDEKRSLEQLTWQYELELELELEGDQTRKYILIPDKWLHYLGGSDTINLYIMRDRIGDTVYTYAVFGTDNIMEELTERRRIVPNAGVAGNPKERVIRRMFSGFSFQCEVEDTRIYLPEFPAYLCQRFNQEPEASTFPEGLFAVGCGTYFELWNRNTWINFYELLEEHAPNIFEKAAELEI